MILNVDFAPTLLDAAGEKVPDDMQGRSFLPLLEGREAEGLAHVDVLPLLPLSAGTTGCSRTTASAPSGTN